MMSSDDGTRSPDHKAPTPGWVENLLDRLGIGVFRINHQTTSFIECNPAMARAFGFESAEVMKGQSIMGHYADPKERAEAVARLTSTPDFKRTGLIRFEAQRVRHDTGEPIHVLMQLWVNQEDGVVQWIDGLAEDMSARSEVIKTFRSAEDRFRVLFETSPVGMAVAGPDGVIGRVNASLCRFLGQDECQLQGLRFQDLIHPDDRAEAERLLRPATNGGAAAHEAMHGTEWRFAGESDETPWGYVSSSWLSDAGVHHSRVLVVQDITQRKLLEDTEMRREKLEAIGLLAGGIAHDFNNVLTTILGNINLVTDRTEVDRRSRERLEAAERAVKRAQDLTRQLITFARGGSPVKRPSSLVEIAEDTASLCTVGATSRIEIRPDPHLWSVAVDPGQIGQVFQNLLINAIEAMQQAGTIDVELANVALSPYEHVALSEGRYVRVSIRDRGAGIPDELRRSIFDPYFTTKPNGSGMGLAIVLSIIRRHAGHIEVHSPTGQGCTFIFYLPATEEAPQPLTPVGGVIVSPPLSLRRDRLLIMDDDEDLLEMSRLVLERCGFKVEAVTHGRAALEAYERARAARQPFSLVILDLTVMGGMGGMETMGHLRVMDPDVRAVVSSGYSSDPVMSDYGDYGFVGVLPKPYQTRELEALAMDLVSWQAD
jgi:PAS domain S-box-containing protein